MSSEERTEQPSARKLQKARERGEVVRSREVHDAMQLAGVVIALTYFGRVMVEGLTRHVTVGLESLGHGARRTVTATELNGLSIEMGLTLAALVGPIAAGAVIGGIASVNLQGGYAVSWEPLHVNLNKLSPLRGLKRLAPSRAGLDLVRTFIIFSALVWLTYGIIRDFIYQASTLGRLSPQHAGALAWGTADVLLRRALVVFGTVAAADYFLQRWRFMKGQKMTKQEVKDEMKSIEGNPEIKARVRRMQRDIARRRMLSAVPKATVVITNPTHIAVALEYHRDRMFAPTIVAMGGDLMAERIKKVAREHGVPIVENVSLARALFANADVGDAIPGDLFEAVAEVLAYLIRLKQLVL